MNTKDKIILIYYFIGKRKFIIYGLTFLLEISLIIFWLNVIYNPSFSDIKQKIYNYIIKYQNQDSSHSNLGINMKIWKKIRPIITNHFSDILNYISINIPNPNLIYRNIESKFNNILLNKNYINRYLPMIIENFNNKLKFRKEILDISKDELIKKTKLPIETINNILSFIDRMVIIK